MSSETRKVAPEKALATVPGSISGRTLLACWIAIAIGLVGFFWTVSGHPTRAWQVTWSNFLFWTSMAEAGIIFGAVLHTAKGHWGKRFRRVAEGMGAFLPASLLVLVLMLLFGSSHIFPWIGKMAPHPGHVNHSWLTPGGVFWRNTILALVLYAASFWFLKISLRPDAPLVAERLTGWRRGLVGWIGREWRGEEAEIDHARTWLARSGPALILLWAVIFTLMAIDLIMSLVPGYISIIWGAYFFVGGWLSMLAMTAFLANRYYRRYDLAEAWGDWEFHDLGKLLFAFTIFWTYFWWSQFLVIWYGNLPRETIFFEQRVAGHWYGLYAVQMILIFALPFLLLLGRRIKMRPGWLAFVGCITMLGFWLERFLLVAPSTWHGEGIPLGWPEASITVGFLGLFGLCYSFFSSTFPKLPIRETLPGKAGTGP
ncbi:MAG TPA: hypothetical protein VKB18_00305 [Gemmatimonadota bacterium]|nr:hypothetical protein [Gemmatimonadota bacterium]